MNYHYYTFIYEPISKHLGTRHEITFKAIDYKHALKRAKREEKFSVNGKQVYKLVEE